MAPARDDEFLPEVWGLYSIGTLWLLLRFAVRLRSVGVLGLQLDDGFAFVALIAWTYTCAIIEIIYHTGTNTDYSPAEVAVFDDAKFAQVEYASKLFLGSWYAYITLIFSLKGIVIMLYRRLFFEPWQTHMLRFTIFLSLSGFTATTLAFSLSCLPFHQRWQIVPPPSLACTASPKILILTSCLNAITDVFLISIPVPLLWTLNKPLRIRFAIFILLASGLFVLAACITRVSLTVVPNIFVLNIARWGVREFAIALVAVNSACLQPLFRRSFWIIQKPHQANRKTGNYIFASAQRARQQFTKSRHRGQVLNSISVGESITSGSMKQGPGSKNQVLEDLSHQVTSDQLQDGQSDSVVEIISLIENSGDLDLERGEATLAN